MTIIKFINPINKFYFKEIERKYVLSVSLKKNKNKDFLHKKEKKMTIIKFINPINKFYFKEH